MRFVFGPMVAGPVLVIETSAAPEAGATVMLQLAAAVPDAESRTLAPKEKVPATVGVPVIPPAGRLRRVRPVGSDPEVIENV